MYSRQVLRYRYNRIKDHLFPWIEVCACLRRSLLNHHLYFLDITQLRIVAHLHKVDVRPLAGN